MKIFRKIRFDLLKKSNSGKYLKYAIGEIVLVVIGILIALQINLWNEERKNHAILTTSLKGVLKELKTDSTNIGQLLNSFKKNIKTRKAFINEANYEDLNLGQLESNLENFTKNLHIEFSYYKNIQNSGITEFGVYKNIIENLNYYYDNALPYLDKLTANYNEQVTREDEFWRYEQNKYEFNYLDSLKSYQTDEIAKKTLIQLLKSPTARNILKIDLRRNLFLIERLSDLQPKLKTIILRLEKVLEENYETI
jgi:hypothetical protein